MLILARKVGEEIFIDKEIGVKVLSVRGGRIRLGITAPDDVRIDREEVADVTAHEEVIARRSLRRRDETGPTEGTGTQ